MIWRILKTLFSLLSATPARLNSHRIGIVAGNGGWEVEDSNHYRKK